jgi:nitrite reductase/ring-hydroxylating ferredoxin subunit
MARHLVVSTADMEPGSLRKVEVAGEVLCLARTEKGDFFAVPDRCTHEDYPLSEGSIWDECVECPMHGSLFDLRTGEVSGLPAFVPTKSFPVALEGEDVYVEL